MASSVVQNPNPQAIQGLLEKLKNTDPDIRFMSLNDLNQILASPKSDFLKTDYNTAARIVDSVTKRLSDTNGEVQNIAVRCMGPLAAKIQSSVLSPLLESLATMNTKKNTDENKKKKTDDEANDVDNSLPAIGLRNAVSALPRPVPGVSDSPEVKAAYAVISKTLIPRILGLPSGAASSNLSSTESTGLLGDGVKISAEAVDVLIEVVRCFGPLLSSLEVEKLQDVVFEVLENKESRSTVKKRAVVALSILAPYLPHEVLGRLIDRIQGSLSQSSLDPAMQRLYISIMGSLARSIPHRFGERLPHLIPHILATLSQEELEPNMEALTGGDEEFFQEFCEVRETALVALEAFLASCGSYMRTYTDETISICLRYLKFDPNYALDDDEDMDEDDEEEEEDDDEDEFDDLDDAGLDDDDTDDASWKVRRCAAKALYTLISTRSNDLLEQGTLYREVALPLVKKLDEREESVRLEVISTLAVLIRKTGEGRTPLRSDQEELLQSLPESRKRRRQSSAGKIVTNKMPYLGGAGMNSPIREETPPSGPRADLSLITPQIIKAATKQLKGKQIPTKQAIILLLDDLIAVQNGGLSEYFDQVMNPVVDLTKGVPKNAGSASTTLSGGAASATTVTLRIAVLNLTSDIAKTHSSSLFQPYLPNIVSSVVAAIGDKFYKISSEALRTAEELIKAITPPRSRLTSQKYRPELLKLYDIIVERIAASQADTEVRQKAIQALGTLLSRTSTADGQSLLADDKRKAGLDVLYDRLRNETTRLQAVRAIDNVAAHSFQGGALDPAWVDPVALELCGQLRKANRALRSASIQALQHLILSPATKGTLGQQTVNDIVQAILSAISTNDSYLLSPSLLILSQLQQENPELASSTSFIQDICKLLKQNIAGNALDSLVTLVTSVGQTGMGKTLMQGVLNVGVTGDPAVIGKVVGALFVASGPSAGVKIADFVEELKASSKLQTPDTSRQSLALAILGEIGLRLGTDSPLEPQLFLDQFHSEPDKVSVSSAVALGRAGAGNISTFLPVIVQKIKEGSSSQQYLLLQSVREILQQAVISSTEISSYEEDMWRIIFSASQAEDNKAVCAECFGRLAILEPKIYLPKLQELLSNESPALRAVAVQGVRYTLPDSDETFDALLKPVLVGMVLSVLKDEDMEIRRLGMTTLNSAAHNKPDLILPHLGQLVPYVMTETVIKPELIREVQMGPFKHQVDDGLEVRKSAYETLYSLMETAFSRISSPEFYDRIIAGLDDDNEIRSLCNLMVTKLLVIDPDEITRRLDAISQCYRQTLSKKLKDNSVKQEIEKQEEANKSVLRVTLQLAEKTKATIQTTGGSGGGQASMQNPEWQSYWEWVNKEFDRQLRKLRDETRDSMS